MSSTRRKNMVPSRRRRDDDDDEEGSVTADIGDDSLSEGSVISPGDDDADVEGSEISDRETAREMEPGSPVLQTNGQTAGSKQSATDPITPGMNGVFKASADTEAMMNGLKISEDTTTGEEINFEDTAADARLSSPKPVQVQLVAPKHETPAERSRREHQEYLKQRDENPAFVPNRGGFFLHDNRSTAAGMNGLRSFPKGRGRGAFNGMQSA